MKKSILLLIIFVLIGFHSFPQWTWQNPFPTSNSLYSVFFPDDLSFCLRNVSSCAGTTHFIVNSDKNWSVMSDTSWCSATPFGSGNSLRTKR